MLNGLDLFSGIGGMSIALKDYVRPITYCEIDRYCQCILLSRMFDGKLPKAPIAEDICCLNGSDFTGDIDIIYGGFPCQDISIAGNGKGLGGERSGLFFEIIRLAKEIKPKWIFLENVPAITSRGGLRVVREITEMGYDSRWNIISASKYVDQNRERWFLLAKLNGKRWEERASENIRSSRKTIVNEESSHYKLSCMENWSTFAQSMREANELPFRMDRTCALGNAVVPQQAKEAFEILMGLK